MLIKNNKGQVINAVFLWLFAVFIYFSIGYSIARAIVDNVIETGGYTGVIYYMVYISPYIPLFLIMFWGYTILNPEPSYNGGGGLGE